MERSMIGNSLRNKEREMIGLARDKKSLMQEGEQLAANSKWDYAGYIIQNKDRQNAGSIEIMDGERKLKQTNNKMV